VIRFCVLKKEGRSMLSDDVPNQYLENCLMQLIELFRPPFQYF
jgi:hypothetical protein